MFQISQKYIYCLSLKVVTLCVQFYNLSVDTPHELLMEKLHKSDTGAINYYCYYYYSLQSSRTVEWCGCMCYGTQFNSDLRIRGGNYEERRGRGLDGMFVKAHGTEIGKTKVSHHVPL